MTLEETLKYMESQVHLWEAVEVDKVNGILNQQGLSNEIKIQQGQDNDVIINGIKYPGETGQKALNAVLKNTYPDYTNGLDKNQILNNVNTALNGIQQNMNSSQSANPNQAQITNTQLAIRQNGEVANPPAPNADGTNGQNPSNDIDVANQSSLPAVQQQQTTEVTPQDIQAVEKELTELKDITPSSEVNSGLSDEDLEKQIADQSKKAQEYLDRISYLTDLANRLLKDPKLAEASNKNKKIKQKLGGNGFLKGLLNTAAGVVGNFIGGIASGMGAAK